MVVDEEDKYISLRDGQFHSWGKNRLEERHCNDFPYRNTSSRLPGFRNLRRKRRFCDIRDQEQNIHVLHLEFDENIKKKNNQLIIENFETLLSSSLVLTSNVHNVYMYPHFVTYLMPFRVYG